MPVTSAGVEGHYAATGALFSGDIYRLTALDGYQVEVTGEDMTGGYVSFYEGQVRSYFPRLPSKTAVRGLYTIEVLQ